MNTDLLQWTIQDRLTKSRTAVSMTQLDVADALSVSRRTVERWESGTTRISRPAILAWSVITGAPARWIETGDLDESDDSVTSAVTHRYRGAA